MLSFLIPRTGLLQRALVVSSLLSCLLESIKILLTTVAGIIFANGTAIDDPPPGFHPGRVEIFRNGTEFSNGTVLATDVPNPNFNSTLV